MASASTASTSEQLKIMERGDRVRLRTNDHYNRMQGVISDITKDEQGVGLVTVIIQGTKFGDVQMFGVDEVQLLGSNIFHGEAPN